MLRLCSDRVKGGNYMNIETCKTCEYIDKVFPTIAGITRFKVYCRIDKNEVMEHYKEGTTPVWCKLLRQNRLPKKKRVGSVLVTFDMNQ